MLVTSMISWQAVNWPGASAAQNYQVYNGAAPTTAIASATGGATSVSVTYDDALAGVTFLIRPVDVLPTPTSFGPAQSVTIGKLSNRSWLRSYVRKSMSDRSDVAGNTPTITDDEINEYVNDAIRDYSVKFPFQKDVTLNAQTGGPPADRIYTLPADVYEVVMVRYTRDTNNLMMYLTEMEWKGGETGATSWVGYAKFGIWQSPLGGRYFPGHYSVYEGNLWIDFDPPSVLDTIYIRYKALYPFLLDDVTLTTIPEQDLELVTLYAEAKAWMEMEAKDTRLSRWRTKEDGSRRDDMPTDKMSTRLFNAYQQKINERRTLRVRALRLVRRT